MAATMDGLIRRYHQPAVTGLICSTLTVALPGFVMLSYTALLKLQDYEDRTEINMYAKVGLASVLSDGILVIWSPMPVVIVGPVCRASTMSFARAAD